MPIEIAKVAVALFEGYALAGGGFALLFLPRVIARLDRRIEGSPKTFRLLLLPGVVALWPLFAWRWLAGVTGPIERTPHRTKAAAR